MQAAQPLAPRISTLRAVGRPLTNHFVEAPPQRASPIPWSGGAAEAAANHGPPSPEITACHGETLHPQDRRFLQIGHWT